ncbi:pentapeptide repeat-containing protein [Lyngbya aestuarii]|uniref:pentapeptide repeat-containing protein n=1 Tax=Lyngbya aestuarii TaxID=118322 RepID=UPI00403D7B14
MSLSIRQWLADRHIELAQLEPSSAQITGIAFRIAQDMEVKSLNPFAISPLAEVLELPLKTVWQVAAPLSQLSVGLLRILSRKTPLKRNEGTWLTFQIAYLNALQGILKQESQLRRPWLNRAEVPTVEDSHLPLSDPQLIALLKTLRPGRLSEGQTEQALSLVTDSFLVQQMHNLARAWFVANGAEETEARLLTQRLSNGLPGHLLTVIAENPLPLAQLQKFVRLGNLSDFRQTTSPEIISEYPDYPTPTLPLDLDREYYRARLLQALSEPLLAEPFSLKDLYVPLKGKELQVEGLKQPLAFRDSLDDQPIDLMQWAISQLEDPSSIAVIEADSGSGKTSFCQIWASRVAWELYPRWMPVLIRLRDVTLGQTLEQTIESALPLGSFTSTDGWFSANSPPCLIILDGLDELPRSSQKPSHLWAFLHQVIQFHLQHLDSTGLPHHKLVITSCPAALDCLIRKYPSCTIPLSVALRRIVIQPMGQEQFRQWFLHWAKLQSKSIAQAYFSFLKHGGVFQKRPVAKELANLVKRPLMLHLAGILHRDALLDESIFQMGSRQIQFEIYERICQWLLGEPSLHRGSLPELIKEGLAHASRSLEAIANLLMGRSPQQLRHQMQVAALKIIQTGRCQAPQALIGQYLSGDALSNQATQSLPALFFCSRLGENQAVGMLGNRRAILYPDLAQEKEPLPLQLQTEFYSVACYIKALPKFKLPYTKTFSLPYLQVEFSHSHLGEYLAAQEISEQLTGLTQEFQDGYGEVTFVVRESVAVAQHLYSLLGYGLLSTGIAELVIERLRREKKRNANNFSFAVLFERLYRFYQAYCRGRWLDECIAHQVHSQLQKLDNTLTILQIDAAVGLNIFVLLCLTAQEAQIYFWPCGRPDIAQDFDANQLLSFIGRTTAFSTTAFWQQTRYCLQKLQLSGSCLNQVLLREVNLAQANLSGAELIGTNLAFANLSNADLSWSNLAGANLARADLAGASLQGADLSGANLREANLTSTNLSNACLFETQLDADTYDFARSSGATFSQEEFWSYRQSLVKLQFLRGSDIFSTQGTTISIESVEGEPLLPGEVNHYGDDFSGAKTLPFQHLEPRKTAISESSLRDNEDEETEVFRPSSKAEQDTSS